MFRRILNDKIGNILAYMATQLAPLYMTKALKLLYLIDETAVRQSGSPITWLDYKVWRKGPVAAEIYHELRHGQVQVYGEQRVALDAFIHIERIANAKNEQQTDVKILPARPFSFEAFSEFEEEIVRTVVAKYGHFSSTDLIGILHTEDSRWHQIVEQFNLEAHFKLHGDTSGYSIDFLDLIEGDELLQLAAKAAYESLELQEDMHY